MEISISGLLVIITGPPAAGKDTVVKGLLEKEDISLKKIVTHTTRPMRPNEKHGVDYYFINEMQFKSMIASGEMVEYELHGSSWKGTDKNPFIDILEGKGNYVWRITPSRAAQIDQFFIEKFGEETGRKLYERTIVFYIDVDDPSVLKQRWQERENKASIEEFEKRYLQDITAYTIHREKFHYRIVNINDPRATIEQVQLLITEHLKKISKINRTDLSSVR